LHAHDIQVIAQTSLEDKGLVFVVNMAVFAKKTDFSSMAH
jgi:hypothetical protein